MVHIGAAIASNITYLNWAGLDRMLWPWRGCGRHADPLDVDYGSSESAADAQSEGVDEADAGHGGIGTAGQGQRGGGWPHRRQPAICATWEALNDDAEHREFVSAGAAAGLSVCALQRGLADDLVQLLSTISVTAQRCCENMLVSANCDMRGVHPPRMFSSHQF